MTLRPRVSRLAVAAVLVAASAVAAASMPGSAAQVGPSDDFRVSQASPHTGASRVAYNATDDEYLAVWASVDASLESRIWGRRIDARTGAGAAAEFLIAEFNPGDPSTGYIDPDVAWNSVDNEYVVVFSGDDTVDVGLIVTTFEIYAQRVSSAGAPVGSPARVSDMGSDDTDGNFDANNPAIAHDSANNQYLVVWDGDDDTAPLVNNENEVFGQLLSSTLVEIGADRRLSDMGTDGDTGADARDAAVAFDGSGYLVVWEGDDDGSTFEIHGQYVSDDGTESDSDFVVSTDAANDEAYEPDVATDPSTSDALVVWQHDDGAGDDFEIAGSIVDGATNLPGTNFGITDVGDATYNAQSPATAFHSAAGSFSVVWSGDHDGITANDEYEIFHVVLDTAGVEIEPVERVSTMGVDGAVSTAVTSPDIAAGPETASGIVWSAENDTPGTSAVWGQFVAPDTDLEITSKVVNSAATIAPGGAIEYVITYANNGDVAATNVVITDTIPAGVSITDVATTGPTLTPVVGPDYAWSIATLPAMTGGTITLTGTATASVDTTITNTATIAGNALHADADATNDSASADVDVDAPPTVVITLDGQSDPTNDATIDFIAEFNEPVTGFESVDVSLGGTAAGASATVTPVDGDTYQIDVSGMSADGTIIVSVPAGSADEIAGLGQSNVASNELTVTYDDSAPTPVVSSSASDPTNGAFDVSIDFGEPVTGFVVTDLVVGNGVAGGFSDDGGGMFSATVAPTADGEVTVDIATAAAADLATNASLAATQFAITYDASGPTPVLSTTSADPTNQSPIPVEVEFGEDVTGFAVGDVVVGNGSAGNFAGSGSSYTFDVTPSGDGLVTVDVGAGVAADTSGNPNLVATQLAVVFDGSRPAVTIDQGAAQPDSANAAPIVFDVLFSESVTGFVGADVTVGGTAGATTAVVTGSGTSYEVAVTDMTGSGTVTATVVAGTATDTAGNTNTASTSTDNIVTYIAGDPTPGVNDPPVVTAPSAVAAELADALALTGADAVSVADPDVLDHPIEVTVDSDDADTTFDVTVTADVVVAGAVTGTLSLTGPQSAVNAALATLVVVPGNVGDIDVTVTADDQGHTGGGALTDSATITMTVTDTVAPVINVPDGGVSASTDPGEPTATVTYVVTVDDPGSAPTERFVEAQAAPTLVCTPASGSQFPIGTTTVTCTATDASSNTSTESFVVTVTDDEAPVISAVAPRVVELPAGTGGPVTYPTPTATDNSGSATVTCAPASGSTMSIGITTVACTAADAAGNTATASFTITVQSVVVTIPATGGSLVMLPWAIALLAAGLFALGGVGVSRRRRRRA